MLSDSAHPPIPLMVSPSFSLFFFFNFSPSWLFIFKILFTYFGCSVLLTAVASLVAQHETQGTWASVAVALAALWHVQSSWARD